MTFAMTRDFFFWCSVINYGFLILWAVLLLTARDGLYRLNARFFRLSAEQWDTLQFLGILFYKMGTWMFFIIPYIALRIVG